MTEIYYIDRATGKKEKEKVYGGFFLEVLYGSNPFFRVISFFILPLISKVSFFSQLYGLFQKSPFSKWKVVPFIKAFHIDSSEFLKPVDSFHSFNDFFIRKLKKGAREITPGDDIAVMPADGRYLVYQDISKADGFFVKGKKFTVTKLLQNKELASKYQKGSLVIARLCPVDYHRFHFPLDGIPSQTKKIPGPLYSVNPIALRKNISILNENKRVITQLENDSFGKVLFIEVGATYVGSIHQTFSPGKPHRKGDEKGFFSFGGSCLILLFEPNRIQFDKDLIEASKAKIEVRGFLGQSLGKLK